MNKIRLLARWGLRRTKHTRFIKESWNERLLRWIGAAVPALLFVCVAIVVYEFGFRTFWSNDDTINSWLQVLLFIICALVGARLLLELLVPKKKWARFFTVVVWLFILVLTLYVLPTKAAMLNATTNRYLFYKLLIYAGVVMIFITEISFYLQFIYSRTVNPGLVFVGSFGFLILIGAILLKLPNAAYGYTSTIDAVFTSASAVCVTGLIVVDTATHFTPFGQAIIMMLIQVGGLGFMTFAGLLAYAVAGNTSLKTQIAYSNIMSSRKVGNIMKFVYQVVFITILFESVGAFFIYISLDDALFERKLDKLFFSIFHSISAFCNAGFSTYSGGLYEPVIRHNYSLQMFIAFLVILGGMGFPIVFNLYRLVRIRVRNFLFFLRGSAKREYFPNVIMLNSRLALVVSGCLLVVGFVSYIVFEQSATLAQHPTITGKLVTAFFGSVTPRTAGFNSVDLTAMTLPMIMIYLLLMWIGASPGSMGGGIKTTTAGVAILNMAAVLRGKDRSEFFRSEISHQSVRRAFAIIVLSLLLIGITVFALSFYDSDKGLIKIAFEAFSAFSTVGLSLGITPQLSAFSKLVLIISMFIGRVGAITLLVILVRQSKQLYYRYPREDMAF
ncbi:TrkH family potassium uptake protein [Aridibaculum aurantiacum]|uniref:TrkH family potassium uptake protein n=1 Tax=Aridibaculum aurantiacum TaxID=2810307 RepID=UPI001A97C334|nr:potassium transporter TrkG [Aridibaculum aurantiacum]